MIYLEKIAAVRRQMQKDDIKAYIIPSSDPHIGEYLPDRFKCIEFISGFTGSAGTIVIADKFSGLWTDSRYYAQAELQLNGSGIQLMKLIGQNMPEYIDWLADHLHSGEKVAYDGHLMSVQLAKAIADRLLKQGIQIVSNKDYLGPIWEDRPALLKSDVFLLDDSVTGESASSKIARLRHDMELEKTDYLLISSTDDIAWLLNVRGADVECNPLVLSHLIIGARDLLWFVDETRIAPVYRNILEQSGVKRCPYEAFEKAVSDLKGPVTLRIDPKKICQSVYECIPKEINMVESMNRVTWYKAIKNQTEQEHLRQTMIKDGRALVRFFYWLERHIGKIKIDEISAIARLSAFRSEEDGFIGESFNTISAYKAHAAFPHYRADKESNAELKAEGIYLVDSGGQYRTGTTDVTRTISLGKVTEQERKDYTLVLKGMIDTCRLHFPVGTKGYQIDAFARYWMWQERCNYGHGTGHGVGFFLNVHEGPQSISPLGVAAISPGMYTSIEPGLYREGKYGIRIENLTLCQETETTEFGRFLRFETITLCPIATDLILKEELTKEQTQWLNTYHQEVFEKLSPGLNKEEIDWLRNKTQPI